MCVSGVYNLLFLFSMYTVYPFYSTYLYLYLYCQQIFNCCFLSLIYFFLFFISNSSLSSPLFSSLISHPSLSPSFFLRSFFPSCLPSLLTFFFVFNVYVTVSSYFCYVLSCPPLTRLWYHYFALLIFPLSSSFCLAAVHCMYFIWIL